MSESAKRKIVGALGALYIIVSLGWIGYSWFLFRAHEIAINRQAAVIKVIVETPELNSVIRAELERRAAAQPK